MASVNKAIIVGNLGRDPETRELNGGSTVCNLSVATTRKYKKGQSQEQVEETEWHRVVVWGKMAAACGKYLAKGRQVYVEGRLQTNKYTDKDGMERHSTQIVAEAVQFLGGRDSGGSGTGQTTSKPYTPPAGADDGDAPF